MMRCIALYPCTTYLHNFFSIFRPHRSTVNVDAAYCYRPSSLVCQSVTLVIHVKTAEPIEMPFGLRTWVGPRNHVLDEIQIPRQKGAILRGVAHCHTVRSSLQKWLKQSRCCVGCGLGWAKGTMGSRSLMGRGNFGGKGRPL